MRLSASDRRNRLDGIAQVYDPSNPHEHFDFWLKRLEAETVADRIRGTHAIELGCATGESTALLAPLFDKYSVVEGSAHNIEIARQRCPWVEFEHALWEEFQPKDRQFSDAILFGALEHAESPVDVMMLAASWLAPGGLIHIMVPNGLSLHRLVGVEMGLQPDPLRLTEADLAQGHMRNYTLDGILADVRSAGLHVVDWKGIFLKVLANRQMLSWEWPLIHALHAVAQRLPEHAAELYVCASPVPC